MILQKVLAANQLRYLTTGKVRHSQPSLRICPLLAREIEKDPELGLVLALSPKLPEPLRDALTRWPEIPEAIRRAIPVLLETVPK